MPERTSDGQNNKDLCNYSEYKSYTEAFSGGVCNGGSGYFSSSACAITSESAIHFPSSLTTGTLPSGLILENLDEKENSN